MGRSNWVRERLRNGGTAVGCFLGLSSPAVAELMASYGFDWLIIETEHNSGDSNEIEAMLRAVDAAGGDTVPLVRVGSSDPREIQRALDMGARGVVVPMVKSAEEARAVVAATRYPPRGTRAFGALRGSRYCVDAQEYFENADDDTLVVLILETKGAIDELEEICNIDGIDALYMGYADMSISLGLTPFQLPHPDVDAVTERAFELSRRTGVAIGNGSTKPEGLPALQQQGFRFIGFGPDYWLLIEAARAGRAAIPRD